MQLTQVSNVCTFVGRRLPPRPEREGDVLLRCALMQGRSLAASRVGSRRVAVRTNVARVPQVRGRLRTHHDCHRHLWERGNAWDIS